MVRCSYLSNAPFFFDYFCLRLELMNAIEAKSISKSYADHIALSDVSITVPEQSVFGLLGPNGAGKTSLIRIINQITGPDSGEIKLFGEPLNKEHVGMIGYLPEERGLYKKMKVGEQSIYLAQLKGMSKQEAKRKLKVWFERLEIGDWWNKKVEELSKGMAQKVQFVTTVLHEPKLLILDEPFSGFDPINTALIRQEIMRLRDEGSTIILSTHNMASVEEICDNIALINQSKVILEGSVSEVQNRYHANEYLLRFEGNMVGFTNALWTNFELITKKSEKDQHEAIIKIREGKNLNDLLLAVAPEVQLIEARPHTPSMNDIFITAVNLEKEKS